MAICTPSISPKHIEGVTERWKQELHRGGIYTLPPAQALDQLVSGLK